jgi:hypothetical protein
MQPMIGAMGSANVDATTNQPLLSPSHAANPDLEYSKHYIIISLIRQQAIRQGMSESLGEGVGLRPTG